MTTPAELMEMVEAYVLARCAFHDMSQPLTRQMDAEVKSTGDALRAAITALAAGECSGAGLADDLRLVAQLESKRMGAMSSGLLKGVIGRLSALPPPPAEGSPA